VLRALARVEVVVDLPVLSLAASGSVGLAALMRHRTRRFGAGVVAGTLASAAIFATLLVVVLLTHFVLGGNELP
jgi:hypothetical protein